MWAGRPARFTFRVRPAWWLSWAAVVAYVAVFVLSLVVYNRIHSRRLVERAVELEREVVTRTAEIRSQAAELETLDRIVEAINREMTLRAVLQALLDHGLKLFPQADKALVTVHDTGTGHYKVAAVSGWAPGVFDDLALTEGQALARYSERAEQVREGVFIVRDFSDLPGSEQVPGLPLPKSMLSMTMTLEGKLEGFLVFDNFTDREAFTGADLRRLERFRQHAISAISKARLLEELSQRTVEAQQASAAKSAFLARMSHELRTPLNSIIGFSDILSERIGSGLHAKYQRFLQNISAAGTHLLGLINDILDLSKIEAGRMQLVPEPIAVRALAEGVVRAMKGVAAERHIFVELLAGAELPTVEADPVRVKQMLFNLLSNAVKFSPDGAVVRMELQHLPVERSPVAGEAVAIAIVDRGIGIDPRHLRRNLRGVHAGRRQHIATLRRHGSGSGPRQAVCRDARRGGPRREHAGSGQHVHGRPPLPVRRSRHSSPLPPTQASGYRLKAQPPPTEAQLQAQGFRSPAHPYQGRYTSREGGAEP